MIYRFSQVQPAQSQSLLHSQEQAIESIGLHMSANTTEITCFTHEGPISTVSGKPLILVDQFTYLGSNISSTESNINIHLAKAWIAIDRLSIISKSDVFDKIKRDFFQAVAVSILLYECTTWTLAKRIGKMLNRYYTKIHAFLNKYCKQYPTKSSYMATCLPPK